MSVDPDSRTRLSETQPDPMIGRTFDGYQIESKIGRGGMGCVYKATQLSLDRPVAIKVLSDSSTDDPQFLERFHREADVLSKLSHPNIVTVFDRGDVDGSPYLVMEYVEGANLRAVVRNAPIPAAEALMIVRSVLSALEHAHAQGIIHRDVKPENVLIAPGGIVKVADFGLSRMVERDLFTRLTRTHLMLGTYEYMAPEQREHAKEADERSDLYATGVVLYEMIAGELPIGNFAPLTRKCRLACADRIDGIVRRSLEKDPQDRYQKAEDMADAISKVLDRDTVRDVRELPSVSAASRTVNFDPLRFATRLDLLATFTTILGFVSYVTSITWVAMACIGRGAFGYGGYSGGPILNSLGYSVPALGFAMLGWWLMATAHGLRRYRPGARQAQGLFALIMASSFFALPYALFSWWVLHGFKSRTYFDARARGLSAEEAVTSIHETVHSGPDAPLKVSPPPPADKRPLFHMKTTVLSVLAAAVLGALWMGGHELLRDGRAIFDSEIFLAYLAAAGSIWMLVVQPPLYRGSSRGPIYTLIGIVVFAIAVSLGFAALDHDIYQLYRSSGG